MLALVVEDTAGWPPARRHRQHDNTEREHHEAGIFEKQGVHGDISQQTR
jgi:hypothetical protein